MLIPPKFIVELKNSGHFQPFRYPITTPKRTPFSLYMITSKLHHPRTTTTLLYSLSSHRVHAIHPHPRGIASSLFPFLRGTSHSPLSVQSTHPTRPSVTAMATPSQTQTQPAGAPNVRTALEEVETKTGAFIRKESAFRNFIVQGDSSSRFQPEPNRYHLYVSLACPWANRCVATLYMKGLQDVIGLSITHPTWQRTRPNDANDTHTGWVFASPEDPPFKNSAGYGSFGCQGCIPDTVNGAKFVRDLYELADDTSGKYSVPVLWDKKEKTIVNNESAEIMRMFNSAFNDYAKHPEIDLFPEHLAGEIEEVNAWVYPSINNGVYRCGFATSQEAYDVAFGYVFFTVFFNFFRSTHTHSPIYTHTHTYSELFSALDKAEEILTKRRYIAGDVLTEADIRLFMTLIRFDPVYVVYFKTDKKCIREYPALREYVRDMYSTPGVKESINITHIKTHYFTSHPRLNAYAIIPNGPEPWWEEDHNRYKMTHQSVAFEV